MPRTHQETYHLCSRLDTRRGPTALQSALRYLPSYRAQVLLLLRGPRVLVEPLDRGRRRGRHGVPAVAGRRALAELGRRLRRGGRPPPRRRRPRGDLPGPGEWLAARRPQHRSRRPARRRRSHRLAAQPRTFELGVTLAPASPGPRLATEALRCVLAHLFADADAHRVVACLRTPATRRSRRSCGRVGHAARVAAGRGRLVQGRVDDARRYALRRELGRRPEARARPRLPPTGATRRRSAHRHRRHTCYDLLPSLRPGGAPPGRGAPHRRSSYGGS
jgi:hypothetical protein